jgi:hypothetical protein
MAGGERKLAGRGKAPLMRHGLALKRGKGWKNRPLEQTGSAWKPL